jgi:hypothetical protein
MSGYVAFVIVRDLFLWTQQTVAWLERAEGVRQIILIDNDSQYPRLLRWYKTIDHRVVRLGVNLGKRGPWQSGTIERFAGDQPYIVTDPDIVPIPECPLDAFHVFAETLALDPAIRKIGFSLKIDDLPDCYEFKDAVLLRSSQFLEPEKLTYDHRFFRAPVDTTMALYQPGVGYCTHPAFRSNMPYFARHLPWYMNSEKVPTDVLFYRHRAHHRFGHWAKKRLPPRLRDNLEKQLTR